MDSVSAFVDSPSEEALNGLTKAQLWEVAAHFEFVTDLPKTLRKDELRLAVKDKLVKLEMLDFSKMIPFSVPVLGAPVVPSTTHLTFEQQKELIKFQLERDRLAADVRDKDRQLEYEKLRRGVDANSAGNTGDSKECNVANMVKLLPKFNDRDLETFFALFENLAVDRRWSDSERTLLLQSVLTGKAQDAFVALSADERKKYASVKGAVLKAYELVPEAYRQKFRHWRKGDRQLYTEFVRELTTFFNRWCTAEGVHIFETLCDLVLLEQFKNTIPDRIVTYITERKVKTAAEAAVLADEFVLIHKGKFVNDNGVSFGSRGPRYHRFSGSRQSAYPSVTGDDQCRYCNERGHWKKECPLLQGKGRGRIAPAKPVGAASSKPVRAASSRGVGTPLEDASVSKVEEVLTSSVCSVSADVSVDRSVMETEYNDGYEPFITTGFVSVVGSQQKVPVKILRDTGASESFIKQDVLPVNEQSDTHRCVLIRGIGMHTFSVPLHKFNLESDLINGEVTMAVRPELPVEGVDIILGNNLAGGRVWAESAPPPVVSVVPLPVVSDECGDQFPDVFCACAVTRAQSRRKDVKFSAISVPVLPSSLPREDLVAAQQGDEELAGVLSGALPVEDVNFYTSGYFVIDGVLVRKWSAYGDADPVLQLVVPVKFRELVLQSAHGDVAGHFGVRKTYQRLLQHFYWPKIRKSVAEYVRTCHVCQLTGKPNQTIKSAPLHPIPVVGQPFEHLIVDCVGPLPPSKSGCAYLLTVMCQATRYPAAYPLRTITTRSVVKALSQFMSIFGIPKIVQSDRGSNFTSGLFKEVLNQLHVKHRVSSAYHAQSQGALERFHCTLKSLLRAYCVELNKDWEEGLPWLLLAAREVTQESMGFSPNDLVFAHKVRGPLSVLKEGVEQVEPPVNLIDYVHGFRRKLLLAWKLSKENLSKAQEKMKRLYDRRAVERVFNIGDQVLALLPVSGSPFCAKFSGPYVVVRQVTELDYLLSTPDRRRATQLCHVNLLKPYYAPALKTDFGGGSTKAVGLAVVSEVEAESQDVAAPEDVSASGTVWQPRLRNSEMLSNLDCLFGHLSSEQQGQLKSVICEFDALFSDVPTCTDVIQHDIVVENSQPIRQRFYRVPPEKERYLEAEVQYLLDHGLAKPSYSSWSSPCLLVAKPDNTFRFCTDYRKVNKVTKPDSFPLPRMEDCIDRVGSAHFVSKFDLLKGYYQVPLTPRAQEISAFITPSGLYSYNVMSFGLRNAPSTFQRLMNRVVAGLEGCAVYLDDVVTYSDTWEEHLSCIRSFFERLRAAKLTVNLAKCEFARATVVYLGKVVGQGQVCPVRAKVQAIDAFPPPTSKKELMRFLGMVGYYRSFCANFSTVVAPLTALLKKNVKFLWSLDCQTAFENAKLLLSTAPVLAAPRLNVPFQLQVDASQVGAGAVLLQLDKADIARPVGYFSKKFNRHQLNYSVIEKEALALVWALQHFDVYVGGGVRPVVVYSDHNPLTFLHSLQSPSQRLMRWALVLQPYNLEIRHIRGVENVMADALSRSPMDD